MSRSTSFPRPHVTLHHTFTYCAYVCVCVCVSEFHDNRVLSYVSDKNRSSGPVSSGASS
eukprot:m.1628434 g.1628434  ORF g.1628434 m.1628434 type:complete len:59 (+) comp25396_c0_seq70:5085-5261(+)